MEAKVATRASLRQWVDRLIESVEVIAPQDAFSYGVIKLGNEIFVAPETPVKSAKEFFFPSREVLLEYRLREGVQVEAPEIKPAQRVLLTRPCDAASLPVLDHLFMDEVVDEGYALRRRNTVIIAVACTDPPETCFCTSVGGSPCGAAGADILLTQVGESFHAQPITARGAGLLDEAGLYLTESSPEWEERTSVAHAEMRGKIRTTVDAAAATAALRFDSVRWQEAAKGCLDCGICTFVCPTCHCFDIQDEGGREGGCRVRIWDSCAFAEYTKMPVGQPRLEHYRRYRQRVMHKFSYYPARFGEILCVGCGRCIRHCPVGVDITEVLEAVIEGEQRGDHLPAQPDDRRPHRGGDTGRQDVPAAVPG